jgi:hypothetical protein
MLYPLSYSREARQCIKGDGVWRRGAPANAPGYQIAQVSGM